MNDNNNSTDLLIQYLDGELEGRALEEMKMKISNDPLLQQELENLQSARQAIKGYGLREKVSSIHNQMIREFKSAETRRAPVRLFSNSAFKVAASIILIIGTIAFYEFYNLSSTGLFMANYHPYVASERRGEDSSPELEKLYKQGSKQLVIDKFEELKQPSVVDYFYVANVYLDQLDAPSAIKSFQFLLQKNAAMNTHFLEDDAEYYLAMSYLLHKEPGKALSIFRKIRNDNQHLYHDKVSSWFLFKVRLTGN